MPKFCRRIFFSISKKSTVDLKGRVCIVSGSKKINACTCAVHINVESVLCVRESCASCVACVRSRCVSEAPKNSILTRSRPNYTRNEHIRVQIVPRIRCLARCVSTFMFPIRLSYLIRFCGSNCSFSKCIIFLTNCS